MSKRTKHKFCTLYEMGSGISSKPEQAGHGDPFLSFSTVFNNYFLPEHLEDLMSTSEGEKKKYSILKGDIFLTRTSETIDELGMSSVALKNYPNATYSGFLKRLRPIQDDVTYHKFMAFYLRSKMFRKIMTNNAVLTLRASLNEDIFSYLNLILPDYDEQIEIGDFLHLINQKIQLNNRINAQLGTMAKALYDYWFVQFDFPDENGQPYKSSGGKMEYNESLKREIPENWKIDPISKCCKIVDCLHSKKPNYYFEEEKCYLLQLENIRKDGLIDISPKYFVSKKDYQKWTSRIEIRDGDIVITNAGRVAAIAQIPKNVITGLGRNITAIRPVTINPWYLFLAFNGLDIQRQISWNTDQGSFFKSFNVKGIKLLQVVRPEEKIEKKFKDKIEPIIRRREYLIEECQQLTQLRDWLLPMLINGQIKVA